ncbi:monovalent cation/H+ antiporter subunit D [Gilvimarinus sp. SDUM040013]|uniref:Monovalent cation/H+ antiporter subunit D n=1 Tax=Gilvimarinus gilvus TaxID=3058038 RepID=A0ABU4RT40_9GAMM|nr:monovalent cation/H+ antiporter subunit D [Gilvimarinus sp. SDUM040013]MDO3387059.1 monovalent cation/H+ antiporter subunit D [Gilvimarinus sp. SDUM040013]MDX6848047.1 monovalent cation/H+ antiporter subunit D [Gilvimarinus sp. SDUM040013]
MNHLIIAPVLIPLVTGILLLLGTGRPPRVQRAISFISISAQLVAAIYLLSVAAGGDMLVYALGNWAPPFGIVLVLDRLSALMVTITASLAFFSLWYAVRDNDKPTDSLHSVVHFLLMGINGAFLTGDLFNLFVFFEVLLIASYTLLLHGGGAARIKSGLHYVLLNLVGSSLFLIAAALLYGLTGTLNMADMAVKVAATSPEQAPLMKAAALILLVVFGLKAAMVPLYFWLPRAYAAAAAPVAAMFCIMTKIGIYAIIRMYSLVFGDEAGVVANVATPWLWPLALITLALGATGALAARELRLQIAYLVIVSVGTMLAGVAMHSTAALSATLYYLMHSTWVCAALFLLADIIMRQRGATSDRIITGPRVKQPVVLGTLFFIGSAAVIGMPPLSGFLGKVMLMRSTVTDEQTFWLWFLLLASSLIMVTALSRSGSTIFWRTESRTTKASKTDKLALSAVMALFATSLVLSFAASPVVQYTNALAEQIMQPSIYIDAVLNHQTIEGVHHD